MSRAARLSVVLTAAWLVAGCAGEAPEARLRRAIEQGRSAAIEKDHARLGDLVSARYSDADGRGRAEMLALVRGYLRHLDPVHVVYKEQSLKLIDPNRAEVVLLVAVASVPLESITDPSRVSADVARVEMEFESERGEWKLLRARWSPARWIDLF